MINLKRIYTKAMIQSIRNSGMWLKEAKILAKKAAKGHARALLIFAGEELGKASYCWMAINGVFPYNHPEVDFRARTRDNVFRSHALKNASAFGIMMGMLDFGEEQQEDLNPMVKDPVTGEMLELRVLLAKVGHFAAWARTRWMYVDITRNTKNKIIVSSPLTTPVKDLKSGLEQLEWAIRNFKKVVKAMPYDENMRSFFSELRIYLEENDPNYPANPEW